MTLQEIYQLQVRWFRLPSWDVGTFWEINKKNIIIFNKWKPVGFAQIITKKKWGDKIKLTQFFHTNYETGAMGFIFLDEGVLEDFESRSDWEEVKLLEE
jgi:hypothetical protein